ncbi:MAG: DUF3037 domain-containing protein [Saprospiraceae bacterium]|nr:DUF3037 domain-containing protein [Saprospiraceae bacterium]
MMHDRQVYEYAIIRFVPRVERGEYLNIGVILLCKRTGFLDMKVRLDAKRLQVFSPDADLDEMKQYLDTWALICQGDPQGGPVSDLDPANRFRWITAPKSTMIQCSQVHPGLCTSADHVLEDLFAKYVL